MLWDPGSVEKDEEEGHDSVHVTPILVPLQKKPPAVEKSVPVLVPDVQDLKDQFQQQQNMLTQIKETLIQNESQLSSKGKQMEVYANKLSQIRARSKNTQGKKPIPVVSPNSPKMQKKLSKENLTKLETPESDKSPSSFSKNRKGKVSELRKCLEENKIKFEERTGKEQSETKKIESLVEQLKTQLEERDKTIHDLQKTIEEPTPKQKLKPKDSVASKMTQTTQNQPTDDSIEIIALQNKIHELETNVLDLEENLKEKESVIAARTQAVTLLSQDLSLKGKNTLESLEETRQEMRTMQNNFIVIEDQLKKDLLDRDNRLEILEEKCKKLESTNFELSLKNAEQQEKIVNLQTKYLEADAERTSLKESEMQSAPDERFEELTKKINALTKELDDRNKSMIKMKIEHKNKIKNLNKTLETLKETSDEKAEIVRLSGLLEEFESVKIGLENRVAELEDEKATEKQLKDQINELEIMIKKQNEDLALHLKTITNLEKENLDLKQSNQEKNVLIEKLQTADGDEKLRERLETLEEQYNRKIEDLKGEHRKEIEMIESYYNAKGDGLDRKALEEYRILAEINNIHVEEQIELLIREKQQLLEKLKSLSGVSSTDSLTFEKMEHSDLRDDEKTFPLGEEVDLTAQQLNRDFHLEKIVNEQQHLINDLQKTIGDDKDKVRSYQEKITELEGTIKHLEDVNMAFKQQIEMSEPGESGKNTKTNTNTKNRIKKIEMELTQSKKTIQEQNEKLKELSEKLAEKEELIQKYKEKIEAEERDDWDRQNVWKNAEDEMDCLQELQKKCLGLENNLYELNEDCERLRKENIEVVHLLSEEKVKRKKLLEELEAKPEAVFEEKILTMNAALQQLERKLETLESGHKCCFETADQWEVTDLQEKLEWTNVVLTSKETEIFRLQNGLEDRNSAIEVLEMDLKELKLKLEEKEKRLKEVTEELKAKEAQLGEISANFEKLQESVNVANEKTAMNETQLKELLATVKEMEGDVFKKETELQEIKGILAEKNLDMSNLRNRLEEVNSDLTYSYQEHLENMGKCLRDKESDYDALLSEKAHLEQINRTLASEKEDVHNEKIELRKAKDELAAALSEKEKLIAELTRKLEGAETGKDKKQNVEDMKIKMKKLAANLKKKAQNETELLEKVKKLEETAAEKENMMKEMMEKFAVEKKKIEEELEGLRVAQEKETKENKGKIAVLEVESSRPPQNIPQDLENEKQALLQALAETTGKYEQMKFNHDQLLLEKTELEKKLEIILEESASEKSILQTKIQENFAVIENLEAELKKSLDQIKIVEEKFFYSEDRRLSLENKNEEMCKKIVENSENLITIDDLSVRIDELLKSEKLLQNCVKNLESSNVELKQSLDVIQAEKFELEKELKGSNEKLTEIGKELKEVKNADGEKSQLIGELTKEVEKLRVENKQIMFEFEKLNRDYEQFEVDFKENFENSQNIEKNLKHKIEELLTENANLTEKCNLLSDEKHNREESEDKKPKKRKSVTFRTDEVEYIKDLKNQLHVYDGNLKQAQEEIENLKAELFRERLRHEVSNVVAEAQEKVESLRSTPEKKPAVEPLVERLQTAPLAESPEERKFDANAFFGSDPQDPFLEVKTGDQQTSEFDSLMWDDGWGEGHLEAEYLTGKMIESEKENDRVRLESEVKHLEAENERLAKELQEQGVKYAKALKKLKEMKAAHDKLQSEVKNSFSDLDAAIVDELKAQIENMEAKEKELLKNLENAKLEKEALLKKIDVLNAGNEKFLEMKERQDNEVEIWQKKNNELLKEIASLRQGIEKPEIRDDDVLMIENRELKNKVEALEWKNCELTEMLEEKQELLEGRTGNESQLLKDIEELKSLRADLEKKLLDEEAKNKAEIAELNEQLNELAAENETLQNILGEMKNSGSFVKNKENDVKNKDVEKSKEDSKIFDYFKSAPADDLFPVQPPEPNGQKERINELENLLKQKEEELNRNYQELENVRHWLAEMENAIKLRDEHINHLQLEKENETSCLKQELENFIQRDKENMKAQQLAGNEMGKLVQRVQELESAAKLKDEHINHLQLEKENETSCLKQELENFMRRDTENVKAQQAAEKEMERLVQRVQELESAAKMKDEHINHLQLEKENETSCLTQAAEKEMERLVQRVQELESAAKLKDQFETIDLNQPGNSPETEVAQKVFELEALLNQREEEFHQLHQTKTNEIENLRQRIFQLEDALRLREETGSEIDALRRKIQELEEFARFKENELYQLESMKGNEIQNLNQRILELENLIRYKEEESRKEIETLTQRVLATENLLPQKDEEIGNLMTKLTELEKSYNDSKLEIERLLNEEKLNVEEKFVEPFQENMKIPVAFEVEALSRTLEEEKQKSENLQYELTEKENVLSSKNLEIQTLTARLAEMKERQEEENNKTAVSEQVKQQLEKMISDLQVEVESLNLQLSVTRRELEEFQNVKDEAMANLKSQLTELETELMESRERGQIEVGQLRGELMEKSKYYEEMIKERRAEEERTLEMVRELEKSKENLENEVEMLRRELEKKEQDVESLERVLSEERSQVEGMKEALEAREGEVADLRTTLTHLQEEMGHFRNFEKQVKELRVAQIKEAGAEVPVTSEGHPDLTDWSEHELAELSARLQSDLDTALYMLHQRDVRCDELTFELMQLLEERDTLQLRLSTAIRINEELRNLQSPSPSRSLQENKDLVDQSNDRQPEKNRVPREDLRQLANKISELHSVSYLKDKTIKDDSVQRHKEQMNLLSRVSDSDITLSRDVQSSPAVLLNWMRGKTTPKVMHI